MMARRVVWWLAGEEMWSLAVLLGDREIERSIDRFDSFKSEESTETPNTNTRVISTRDRFELVSWVLRSPSRVLAYTRAIRLSECGWLVCGA